MAQYELMYILRPDLDDERLQSAIDRITQQIVAAGGTVEKTDRWGRRRLAYPIAKRDEGYYVVTTFQGSGTIANEVTHLLNIAEDVMRSIVVRLDDRD